MLFPNSTNFERKPQSGVNVINFFRVGFLPDPRAASMYHRFQPIKVTAYVLRPPCRGEGKSTIIPSKYLDVRGVARMHSAVVRSFVACFEYVLRCACAGWTCVIRWVPGYQRNRGLHPAYYH